MTCARCRKRYSSRVERCPHCGAANSRSASGVFQTSSVLISAGGADLIYRSVEEVPTPLRNQLLKSTNGANSATVLIADRRGREEIARAMRSLPGPVQRKLMQAVVSNESSSGTAGLSRRYKAGIAAILVAVLIALVRFLFLRF